MEILNHEDLFFRGKDVFVDFPPCYKEGIVFFSKLLFDFKYLYPLQKREAFASQGAKHFYYVNIPM